MKDKSYKKLELDKILAELKKETYSDMAKEMIDNTEFSQNVDEVKKMQKETSEAAFLIRESGGISLNGLKDVRGPLQLAKKDGTLSMEQFIDVLSVLQAQKRVQNFFKDDEIYESYPIIMNIVGQIPSLKNLTVKLEKLLDIDRVDFKDNASGELSSVRKQIKNKRSDLKGRLEKVKRSFSKYLQDEVITVRNNRYVLPVKAEHQGEVKGVTHDYSTTGATVYIEPESLMELSNEIARLTAKEEREVERLLRLLSQDIKNENEGLKQVLQYLVELDFIMAKGSLAIKMNAVEPEINREKKLDIIQGRHPLLGEEVVPVSVNLGKEFNTLVITGPNTGGKTVTLKTVGLFSLMTQYGLHIPADDGSVMAVFDEVFADIGDEQNIEQSLSTFSSHMKNIIGILENASSNSLVLLDELGAGTDPTEGSALAMAILEYLHSREIRTIATTHFTGLKNFAYKKQGMENASVEFDEKTLEPTYKLMIGIPGKSNALVISKRLGLKDEIIETARSFIGEGDLKVDELISSLTKKEKKSEELKEDIERSKAEVNNLKARLTKKEEELKEKEKNIIERAREEAAEIITEAKRQAERQISEIRKLSSKDSHKEITETSTNVRNELTQTKEALEKELNKTTSKPIDPSELKPGTEVYVKSLDKPGTFQEISEDKKEAQVQVGLMKVNVKVKELYPYESNDQKGNTAKQYGSTSGSPKENKVRSSKLGVQKAGSMSQELDIRGHRIDEAIQKIDKYLDDALLAGLNSVRIIHGKGTGDLRRGVHFHLEGHGHIKNYRLGEKGEGGEGVTVVTLAG
ncbi:endonuclease MutS2 [Natranaerofaba carboxydovora]|uniref:endonuclease MutS2 n=1 Tax=Natranaerofaba carboxydovora TaxID=2742683 RepID=UPI001F12AAE1|nr:endonuclease MutS2 [Natranaerofaba carboxydovora]UMZ74040.1 Endonuclease MutS2 [Natranaerofaba carboxydovora]